MVSDRYGLFFFFWSSLLCIIPLFGRVLYISRYLFRLFCIYITLWLQCPHLGELTSSVKFQCRSFTRYRSWHILSGSEIYRFDQFGGGFFMQVMRIGPMKSSARFNVAKLPARLYLFTLRR